MKILVVLALGLASLGSNNESEAQPGSSAPASATRSEITSRRA